MTCKCGSNRLMQISGKSSDLHDWSIPHLNINNDGYAPDIPGVCGGDYINITFCLDCGTLQNFKPIDDGQLRDILNVEECDYDEDDEGYGTIRNKFSDEEDDWYNGWLANQQKPNISSDTYRNTHPRYKIA